MERKNFIALDLNLHVVEGFSCWARCFFTAQFGKHIERAIYNNVTMILTDS